MISSLLVSLLVLAQHPSEALTAQVDAPGLLVDRGGYNVHALTMGDVGPVVVYFHGAGNAAAVWLPVMSELENEARQFAFDDPGAGWSDLAPLNATLRQQAYDAAQTLEQTGVDVPVVLVGHSRGGLVALEFARLFPERVASMVLVDSSHPNMMLRFRNPEDGSFSWQAVRTRHRGHLVPEPGNYGLAQDIESRCFTPERDVSEVTAGWPDTFADWLRRAYNQPICQPQGLRTYFAEELEEMGQNWADYRLGSRPLTVLYAADRDYEGDANWSSEALAQRSLTLSVRLSELSDRSVLTPLNDVSHAIPLDAPREVAAAIRAQFGF